MSCICVEIEIIRIAEYFNFCDVEFYQLGLSKTPNNHTWLCQCHERKNIYVDFKLHTIK